MVDATLVIATLLKIVFILAVAVGAFAPALVWAERRQSAMIQDRVGPHRAGFKVFGHNITLLGLLHPLADAVKMIWKEDFVPPRADKFLHAVAPIIALIPAIAAFAVIPFASTLYLEHLGDFVYEGYEQALCWVPAIGSECVASYGDGRAIPMQIASLDVGILFIFAIAGTGVVGAAVAGYSSDNKYSLLGGMRAAGQMVSYEVTLGLTLVGAFMIYNTLRLEEMVAWQGPHPWRWGIVVQPLAFILYLCAAIAETKRIPFDVPEGESELVGGYFTEYSGMKFGMFMMGEFIEVVVLSAIAVTIFFGGYNLPFLTQSGFDAFGYVLYLPHWTVLLLQVGTFLGKVVLFMWFQLMIRWSLPRFRYDQIMKLCWKLLLPLSLINILVTGVLIILWPRIVALIP